MDSASVSDVNSCAQMPNEKSVCPPVPVANPFANVEASVPIYNNWCVTKMDAINFSFVWKIDHFSLCKEKVGEQLKSSTFFAGPDNEFQWCLRLYPMGDREKAKNHLSLFLMLIDCKATEVMAQFKFFILNAEGRKSTVRTAGASEAVCRFTRLGKEHTWGWNKFLELDILRNKANGLLPDDSLTILCEGRIAGVRSEISGHVRGFQAEAAGCTLSEDFGSLFENRKLSDVTLSVGAKNFLVHKAILAARSPVFAAMFEHEMEESRLNKVVIEDVDSEVLGEMLVYIYTGKSPSINFMSDNLLAAADKYEVAGLKLMCQETLCSTMSVENVVDLLVLADRHCAEQLKIQAGNFINTHVKDVICTPAWDDMILKYPYLFAEAFKALASK